MDTKKEMRVVAFVLMLFAICIAEDQLDSGYIFTSPRNIRLGEKNPVEFYNFAGNEGFVTIKLFYSDSYNGNETLAQEEKFSLEEGQKYAIWDLDVKSIDIDNLYNGRLQIIGTIGDECINGSDRVNLSPADRNFYLIQTDKPIYKPGQEVQFRVLKLDRRLRPSKDENDIAEVYIEDPQGTRLYQYKEVNLGEGIVQLGFQLADQVVVGMWRITVSNNNKTESQTFEVKEYVLPKFGVTIQFPSFVLANAETVDLTICANYTYGKPVKGNLTLNLSLERYSYSRDKTPVLSESFKLDGCYKYTLNISLIEPNNVYRYRRIMAVANVVEDGTDVQRNATEYLQRQYLPLNLNFNTDQNYRQSFKPGLPYNGRLKVTNPDDSPAAGEPIEICATVSRKTIILDWLATKEIKYCSNYTSDVDGYIKYTLSPQSTDCESVQLEARSLKYARDSRYSGSRLDSLNQPSVGMTLSPFYSPSGSFVQLKTIGSAIPCGTKQNFKLLFTAKSSEDKDTEFNLRYEVRKQGRLIQTGYKNVNFNIEDDVSDKFENEDELINDSVTQIVPAPKSTPSSDNDSAANDDDENCQIAKDVKYIPPIGEIDFEIDVDANLSPSFTLLVFYVRDDREVVADSQNMEVEKCFKNQVDFEFGDEIKQPGTKTSITVKSSPNSLCGIKVVDKSVSLLNSNNQLTKEKVFQILESLDSGNYYGGNPCNEQIPQPGLYSAKQASIIRPPGHWSSSSYQDSLSSFQAANILVISNLKMFTRPCTNGGGYGGGPIYQAESFSANGGHAMALASTARRPAAPAFAADAKIGDSSVSATKSSVEIRDYFPETWLFEMEATGPDGVYISKETLPHTITEWEGSAVCVNAEDGLGLSNITTIKGFQAFFISYTLPYSVIRGEEFFIVVSIFSYANGALPITVSLDKSDQFIVTSNSIDGNMCVEPDTSENLRIKVRATTVGTVNITVRAQTADSNDVCGDSIVYDGLAKDAITQSFEVEAEGFPVEKVESILFCPTDEEDQTFRSTLSLILPENVVPDSARAIVDVTGNVMGPAIKNLDNLVSLPTGCGEQNMVKFTPNYVVLDYLLDIGKLTENIKKKAIRNLETGYQRELTYRHKDGSFSAFGEIDKEGSMFLTAFVLRSFVKAKRYITIDDSILIACQNWIISKQQADGCFPNTGKIIDRGIQGGLEKEKNLGGITAYVVSSLLISNYENKTVINDAVACLREDKDRMPYNSFLCAYAEALAGETEAAKDRIDNVRPIANKTGGVEYYKNPNGTLSLDLETAAYAVLAKMELDESTSDVLGLIRYMSNNLSPRGGFYSTQDTCVGLEALSQFAKKVYADPVDMVVSLSGSFVEEIEINEDNKLLVQRNIVSDIPGDINVEASGSGCGLIQVALRYNTNTPPEEQSFYFEVVGKCISSDCKQREITVITSFILKGKASGMSVIQIKMVSGTVPVRESIDKLKADEKNQILRVDVEENSVVFYLGEITNDGEQYSFEVQEVVEVENPQPGSAKVYDYYSPELSATTSYSFGNPDNSGYSPDSGSTEP